MRENKGLSMEELAQQILTPAKDGKLKSITSGTISNIENDKNNPSADVVIALAMYFDVSTDWILTGQEFHERQDDSSLSKLINNTQSMSNDMLKIKSEAETVLKKLSESLNKYEHIIDILNEKQKEPSD